MDCDRAVIAGKLEVPDRFQQLVSCEHLTGVRSQEVQQVKLTRGETDLSLRIIYAPVVGVDSQLPEAKRFSIDRGLLGRAPEHRPDARRQFARAERLRDAVIGAE